MSSASNAWTNSNWRRHQREILAIRWPMALLWNSPEFDRVFDYEPTSNQPIERCNVKRSKWNNGYIGMIMLLCKRRPIWNHMKSISKYAQFITHKQNLRRVQVRYKSFNKAIGCKQKKYGYERIQKDLKYPCYGLDAKGRNKLEIIIIEIFVLTFCFLN